MADMIGMLPTLDDTMLANLLANARRLSSEGDARQRASASAIMAAAEAECAKRAAAGAPSRAKRGSLRRNTPTPSNDA